MCFDLLGVGEVVEDEVEVEVVVVRSETSAGGMSGKHCLVGGVYEGTFLIWSLA